MEPLRRRRASHEGDNGVRLTTLVAGLRGIYASARRVALAMREAYGCKGISLRQHDGTAAGQEIDHLHVHVFPRLAGDRLYERNAEHRFASPDERAPYAARLRNELSSATPN